jgi:hypothetical protein
MNEFNNVMKLLARGDVEAAASEFSDAVYARVREEADNKDKKEEHQDES